MTTQAKWLVIGLVVIVALGIAGFTFLTPPAVAPGPDTNEPQPSDTPNVPDTAPTSTPQPAADTYTMIQVAAHSGASDCWTVIRGSVYNLTTWISQHPGGQQAILQLCGKDGTSAFVGQHGGSTAQENQLVAFKIGVLAQ